MEQVSGWWRALENVYSIGESKAKDQIDPKSWHVVRQLSQDNVQYFLEDI